MADNIALETERLTLRTWREDDCDAMFNHLNDSPEVMLHMGGVQDRAASDAGVDRMIACQVEHGHCFWLLEAKENNDFLGFCGLKRVNDKSAPDIGSVEIGWRLRVSAWGQGFAKEGAIASMDYAFDKLDAPFVSAFTIASNTPSWGLMERLGMKRREDLDFYDERWGPIVGPEIVYRITASQWAQHRKELVK